MINCEFRIRFRSLAQSQAKRVGEKPKEKAACECVFNHSHCTFPQATGRERESAFVCVCVCHWIQRLPRITGFSLKRGASENVLCNCSSSRGRGRQDCLLDHVTHTHTLCECINVCVCDALVLLSYRTFDSLEKRLLTDKTRQDESRLTLLSRVCLLLSHSALALASLSQGH